MKIVALRNVPKKTITSPDYILYEGKKKVGVMYKNKDRSGLMYFNILIDDSVEK